METTRQSKIARLIQKELGQMFQRQTQQTPGVIISVTEVSVTSDLAVAKVYLSFFPDTQGEELLKNIVANAGLIRRDLGRLMRHQLRSIPELQFFRDSSIEYGEAIDKLLDQL